MCKDCKYEQDVQDRSLKQCPRCDSKNIKIFLFGSTKGQVGKSKIFDPDSFCCCLLEILIPLIAFLIIFLSIPRSGY
ncbi:MAG: hypothetical protein ACFFDN_47850 [Candidatus Hodarchaeota archaeon]